MKGASIASQFAGKLGGGGSAFSGFARRAREYSVVSFFDNMPVSSKRHILIPSQKLPKASHALPFSSKTKSGSIALYLSSVFDSKTSPLSIHLKSGFVGSRVLLVARAIPEV